MRDAAEYLAQAAIRSRQIPVLLWIVCFLSLFVVRIVLLVLKHYSKTNTQLALSVYHTRTRWLNQRPFARWLQANRRFPADAMPTVGELVAVLAYLFVISLACVLGHTGYPSKQALRKSIAMRTGTLAFANYPLLIGLVGRNMLISRVTGVSQDALRTLHRWSGRTVVILSLAHTIAYLSVYNASATSSKTMSSILAYSWQERFFKAGVVAIAAAVILLLSSWKVMRRRLYEVFIWTHILSAVVLLYASLLHERWSTNATSVIVWIYIGCGIWALDYCIRGLNVAYCCLARRVPMASLTRLPGDLTQVDITLPSGCLLQPGATVYLCLWRTWQWHPFTVLATDLTDETLLVSDKPEPTRQGSCSSFESDKTLVQAKDLSAHIKITDEESGIIGIESQASRIRLLVKAHNGMTRQIHDMACVAALSGRHSAHLRVLLDGPYHNARHARVSQRNILMVAGGVGITAAFPAFQKACRGSVGRRLHLVWLVRTRGEMDVLYRQMQACLAQANATPIGKRASVTVFVTQQSAPAQAIHDVRQPEKTFQAMAWQPRWRQSLAEIGTTDINHGRHRLRIEYRRPDLSALLDSAIHQITADLSNMQVRRRDVPASAHLLHVSVCGSGALFDAMRLSVAEQGRSEVGVVFDVLR